MSNVDEPTKNFLRLSALLHDNKMDNEDKISYTNILEMTTKKYEDLVGSDDWSPKVPNKSSSDEPDVPKAMAAAIDKAVEA